ncbi:MAG: hypothetical protein H6Q90_5199, partial [Deltaproteobacteria bacterium]|nr:hypothetical protein [Deltaproteobacteria bacterium]
TEAAVTRNMPVNIEFGPGGPRVRLFVGDDREIEALAPAPLETQRPIRRYLPLGGAILALIVVVLALVRC